MTARCYAAAQDVLPSLALIVDDAFIEHMRLGRKQLEEYYPVFCLAVLPRRTYFEGVFLSLGSRFSRCLFLCRSALRSRGLASNLILYDVALGESAQARGCLGHGSASLGSAIGCACAGLPAGGSGSTPGRLEQLHPMGFGTREVYQTNGGHCLPPIGIDAMVAEVDGAGLRHSP